MNNKDIWNNNWKKVADYSTNSAGNRWAFYLMRKILKDIHLDAGVIVDAGCGMGNKSAELASIFPDNHVIGMDFSNEGISFASEYYKDLKNLEFRCGDVTELNRSMFPRISMITSFEVIEHIKDWEFFLNDLCEMTDRYILLSTPTGRMRKYEEALGHYRNFHKIEIERYLLKKGFKKIKVLYAGFPFWSPITRDLLDLHSKLINKADPDKTELVATCNPVIHSIVYFLYRFLSFDSIGDQFIGLFEKNSDEIR